MRMIGIVAVALFTAAAWGQAQSTLLDAGYRDMYNLDFDSGHNDFHEWELKYPDDPMGPVSDAAGYLLSEFARLHILETEFFVHDQHFMQDHKLAPDPTAKRNFDTALAGAERLAAAKPNDENSQFVSILAGGLRSDYMALIEKRYAAAFKESKASRALAERLLTRDPNCYDAWLAVGIENYLLGMKPLFFRWLLKLAGGERPRPRRREDSTHGRKGPIPCPAGQAAAVRCGAARWRQAALTNCSRD